MSEENVAPVELDIPQDNVEEVVEDTTDAELMAGGELEEVEDSDAEEVVEAPKETFKLTIDGEEVEVDLETLKKGYSHNQVAAKKMTEAQKLQKDVQSLLDLLKDDPIKVRKALQPDFDEKAHLSKRLAELIDRELETPEEKQAREDAEELRDYRERKKREREESDNLALQNDMQQEIAKLDLEFAEALKEVGLPNTDSARRRLAQVMLEAEEAGKHIPTKTLAAQVKKDMQDELKELLKSSDDDSFEQLLGSDLLTKAQKLSLKKVKVPGNRTEPAQRVRTETSSKSKPLTKDELLNEIGIF